MCPVLVAFSHWSCCKYERICKNLNLKVERSCSLFQKQVALTQLFKMLCLGQYQKKCRKLACCKFWFTLFRSLRREFIAFTDNIIQRPVKVVGFHETYPMEAGMMPASQPVQ